MWYPCDAPSQGATRVPAHDATMRNVAPILAPIWHPSRAELTEEQVWKCVRGTLYLRRPAYSSHPAPIHRNSQEVDGFAVEESALIRNPLLEELHHLPLIGFRTFFELFVRPRFMIVIQPID